MRYIAQYIKKLCPEVVISNSKTTESVYYQLDSDFVVRLSEHIGWYEKGKISVVKSFNTDDFIVMVDTSPFPVIKTRKEVKELIKTLYEVSRLSVLSKKYHTAKQKAEFDAITEWDKYFSRVCQITPNARYFGSSQKTVLRDYFNEGIRGEKMLNEIRKIKPTTSLETIKERFNRIIEKTKK